MKLDRKHYVAWALALALILFAAAILSYRHSRQSVETGADSGSEIAQQDSKLHRFIPALKAIDSSYYADTFFDSCFNGKLKACVDTHLKAKPTLGNDFVSTINALGQMDDNENFDNCLGDSLRACGDMAVKNRLEKSNDANACESYANPVEKESCYEEAYPKIAIAKDDPTQCNNLSDPFHQKYCLDTYNKQKAITTKDQTWCSRLSDADGQQGCKNSFYASVAINTNDPDFCKQASSKNVAASCLTQYAHMAKFSELGQCNFVNGYASYFADQKAADMVHDDCVNLLLAKTFEQITPETKDASVIAAAKDSCNVLVVNERRAACLELVTSKTTPPPGSVQTTPAPAPATPVPNATPEGK